MQRSNEQVFCKPLMESFTAQSYTNSPICDSRKGREEGGGQLDKSFSFSKALLCSTFCCTHRGAEHLLLAAIVLPVILPHAQGIAELWPTSPFLKS